MGCTYQKATCKMDWDQVRRYVVFGLLYEHTQPRQSIIVLPGLPMTSPLFLSFCSAAEVGHPYFILYIDELT